MVNTARKVQLDDPQHRGAMARSKQVDNSACRKNHSGSRMQNGLDGGKT